MTNGVRVVEGGTGEVSARNVSRETSGPTSPGNGSRGALQKLPWSLVLLAAGLLALASAACDDGESDRPGGSGGAVGTGGTGGSGGDGGTGGTGGTGGDGGTGGTGGQEGERLLTGRACTDFSGALDRVFIEGESLEPSPRCVRMALFQADANPPPNLQLPERWAAEPAQLHIEPCDDTPIGASGKPVGIAVMNNEIVFETVDGSGFPTTFSADVTFVDGSQRYRLLTGKRVVSDTCPR